MTQLPPDSSSPLSSAVSSGADLPLGENPAEREAIHGFMAAVEALLRQPRRTMYQLRHGEALSLTVKLAVAAAVLTAGYGVIVGSCSGGVQWWWAPAKIVVGTFGAALICLPSLYLFACLSGSPAQFWQLAGTLGGMLALAALLLVGFVPVAWLFSQSTESMVMMGGLHLLFWVVAMHFGVRFLLTTLRHFGLRSETGVKLWVVIFCLVSLQMTAALRPLIGTADTVLPTQKKFFLAHWSDCLTPARR